MKDSIKVILNVVILMFAIIFFYLSVNGLFYNEIIYMGIALAALIFINIVYFGSKKRLLNYIFIILNIIGSIIFIYLIIVEYQLKVR